MRDKHIQLKTHKITEDPAYCVGKLRHMQLDSGKYVFWIRDTHIGEVIIQQQLAAGQQVRSKASGNGIQTGGVQSVRLRKTSEARDSLRRQYVTQLRDGGLQLTRRYLQFPACTSYVYIMLRRCLQKRKYIAIIQAIPFRRVD